MEMGRHSGLFGQNAEVVHCELGLMFLPVNQVGSLIG